MEILMMVDARDRAITRSQDRLDRIKAAMASSSIPTEGQLRTLWPEFFTEPDETVDGDEDIIDAALASDDETILLMPDMDPAEIQRILRDMESAPITLGPDDLDDGGWQ